MTKNFILKINKIFDESNFQLLNELVEKDKNSFIKYYLEENYQIYFNFRPKKKNTI